MVKTFAVVQHKGGVGKTTLAVNLAAGLAASGQDVLLIDLDPQGSASEYLGVSPTEEGVHLAELLEVWDTAHRGKKPEPPRGMLAEAAIQDAGLWIVPGDLALSRLNRELQSPRALKGAIALPSIDHEITEAAVLGGTLSGRRVPIWPFLVNPNGATIIIDTPPGWGMLSVNALVACDQVIAPVEPKHLSMVALVELMRMIDEVRKEHNRKMRKPWIVPSRVQRTRLAYECLEELRSKFGGNVLPAIRESARVAEAPGFHKPLSEYAPGSIGDEDFSALTKAVVAKLPRKQRRFIGEADHHMEYLEEGEWE